MYPVWACYANLMMTKIMTTGLVVATAAAAVVILVVVVMMMLRSRTHNDQSKEDEVGRGI
jgi:uncharacterized membrane protein